MAPELGKSLIVMGLLITVIGLFILFKDKIPGLGSIGRLPGDIAIEKESFKFYFPLGTSLLVSLVLSLLFWLFGRR